MRFLLPAVLLATLLVPGCSAEEKICEDGQIVVESDAGGRSCEDPAPDDRQCPEDQILLKNPDAGVEGCIPNVYRTEPYTDLLRENPSG